jgi:hypothetical protein
MKRVFVTSFLVLVGTYGIEASAQEVAQPSYFQKQMAAPVHAFEIGAAGLYNQGWGNLTDSTSPLAATTGRRLQDIGGAGIGAELDLGYRFIPQMAAGIFGQISEYDADQRLLSGTNVRSLLAGIQASWHFRPFHAIDPWLSLGSAYRGHWIVPDVGGITSHQGWEVARLGLGADMRATREIAIAPFVTGGLDLWFKEKFPNQDSVNLSPVPASFYFGAGVMGRFDIGGRYITPATMASAHASR